MVKKIGKYKIPFLDGELQARPRSYYYRNEEIVWVDNYVFKDTMRYVKPKIMQSETSFRQYSIYAGDLRDLITNAIIDHGIIEGIWTFVKRGNSYGIALLHCENAEDFVVDISGEKEIIERLAI